MKVAPNALDVGKRPTILGIRRYSGHGNWLIADQDSGQGKGSNDRRWQCIVLLTRV